MRSTAGAKRLRPVYPADDLFACESVVERVAANGDDFIFTCKEISHKALYDFIDGAERDRHEIKVRKGKTHETHRYRFIDKVPLRNGKDAVLVNWINFEILDAKGIVKYKTALVTSLPVTKSNVADVAACGRARWKIENESLTSKKSRLRARTQLWPWRELSGHDARDVKLSPSPCIPFSIF